MYSMYLCCNKTYYRAPKREATNLAVWAEISASVVYMYIYMYMYAGHEMSRCMEDIANAGHEMLIIPQFTTATCIHTNALGGLQDRE